MLKIRESIQDWRAKHRARSLLREFYRKSFAQACLYIKTNYISPDAVDIYISHSPPFIAVLEQYKQRRAEKDKLGAYEKNKQLFNNEKPLASEFLNKSKEILLMLENEREAIVRTPALTPVEVSAKNNKLLKIDEHIKNTQATIDAQRRLLEQIMPPKRKVGRPKGAKNNKE